ncbi:MAG TPA: two-component regulator propeller domain-containing protein [Dyadobacter sp.]|nr:two-component regulator propeller domain-containing protein [Dyadobacter sp.]
MEDSEGFIWISSQGGLNRFDGQTLKSFVYDAQNVNSIGKGEVRGMAQSPSGDIWLGTEVGISRYMPQSDQFENYFLKNKLGQPVPSQHQVVHADLSSVIYLNDRQGLVRMNYTTGEKQILFKDAEFSYGSRTDIVHFDQAQQKIWLLLPTGLVMLDLQTGHQMFAFTGKENDLFKKPLHIYALFHGSASNIWLSTDQGLISLVGASYQIHDVGIDMSTDLVFSIAQSKNADVWLATSKSGLIRYDPNSKKVLNKLSNNPFIKSTLTRDHLSKIFIDSQGYLWVNTDPAGVDIVFPSWLTVQKYQDDPRTTSDFNNASIRGISQDFDGNIWVGTSGEEIRRISKDGRITRPGLARGVPNASVRGIYTDSKGGLWVSTVKQLLYLKRGARRFEEIKFNGADAVKSNHIKGVLEIRPSVYFVATMAGIYKYSLGQSKLLTGPREQFSGAMHYHRESNELFVGRSEKDLRCYQVKNDTLLPVYDKLAGHNILDFSQDPRFADILWIGTDNGLVKFDFSQRKILKVLSTKHGLPDLVVYSVLRDNEGLMWMSTNNGIARMFADETVLALRATERIEFNSFASLKAADGSLYFGSAQGLYKVNPKSFKYPSAKGLFVSARQTVDSVSRVLPIAAPLRLPYNENSFSFELAALDFLSDVQPVFEYRINSADQYGRWISNGKSAIANFQNLPPGKYQFEFRAADSNGFYTGSHLVDITIEPPFWLRWWFVVIMGSIFALLIFLIVKAYVRRQQVLQQRLSSRIILAQESERLRIAMDIHDDVNNTLAAARGYLQSKRLEFLVDVQISRKLILKATEDLRNITHDLMPVQFEQNDLSQILEKRIQEWNEESAIRFVYIFAGEYRKLRAESELMIYRIVTEVVNNIKKHSQATTSIIQLIYQDRSLVVSVEDDGVGIQKVEIQLDNSKGIGLKNIYSRAEYLHASLEINSNHHGVLIQLDVPYGFNTKN